MPRVLTLKQHATQVVPSCFQHVQDVCVANDSIAAKDRLNKAEFSTMHHRQKQYYYLRVVSKTFFQDFLLLPTQPHQGLLRHHQVHRIIHS